MPLTSLSLASYLSICSTTRVPPDRRPSPIAGSYHADVASSTIKTFCALGYRAEPLGGGRIRRTDAPAKTIHIYGYSVGFGGSEGGPPGRGMGDHSQVAALARETFPEYEVSFSADGY